MMRTFSTFLSVGYVFALERASGKVEELQCYPQLAVHHLAHQCAMALRFFSYFNLEHNYTVSVCLLHA